MNQLCEPSSVVEKKGRLSRLAPRLVSQARPAELGEVGGKPLLMHTTAGSMRRAVAAKMQGL